MVTKGRRATLAGATVDAKVIADFRRRLRSAGLRSTAPRLTVLHRLFETGKPLSHAELTDALVHSGFDRVTVYRNLSDLAAAGLVTRTDLGDHTWRFELQGEAEGQDHKSQHPHFTCTECGAVTCLPEEAIGLNPRARGLPKAVARRAVRVTLQGPCDDCL